MERDKKLSAFLSCSLPSDEVLETFATREAMDTEIGCEVGHSRAKLKYGKTKEFADEPYHEARNMYRATVTMTKGVSGTRATRSDTLDVSNVEVVNTDEKDDEESESTSPTIPALALCEGRQGRQRHRRKVLQVRKKGALGTQLPDPRGRHREWQYRSQGP